MTTQIRESLLFEGQRYAIEHSNNWKQLFNPKAQGMSISDYGWSTGCNRNYYCQYAIIDRQLMLMELNLYPTYADHLKFKYGKSQALFCGKSPDPNGRRGMWCYRDLELRIDYTGGLVLCQGYIRIEELNTFGNANDAPMFLSETICEAIFEGGVLIDFIPRSQQIKEIRDRVVRDRASSNDEIDFSLYKIERQILAEQFKCQYY